MKNIKKMSAIGLILIMLFAITACGAKSSDYTMDAKTSPATGGYDGAMMGEAIQQEAGNMYSGEYATDEAYDMAVTDSAPMEVPMKQDQYSSVVTEGEMYEAGAVTPDQISSSEKKIITTYSINLETVEYDGFVSQIEQYINDKKGYIEYSDSWGSPIDEKMFSEGYYDTQPYPYYSGRSKNMTVRIPEAEAQAFLQMLKENGYETSSSVSTNDVSLEYYDTEARIKALETQRDRILELITQAQNVDELILLEQRLTDINYELDSKQTQMKYFENQIQYTTIHVYVNEVVEFSDIEKFNPSFGDRIVTGLKNTFSNIRVGFVNLVIWIIVNSVYFVMLAIVVIIALIIIKKRKAKKNQIIN